VTPFEYYLELVPNETSDDTLSRLNYLGAQGWEFVFLGGNDAQGNRALWFKRQAAPEVPGGPPTVSSISPNVTNTGSQKISVRGTNYTPQSVIVFDGIEQATTFQDDTWLQATVASPGDGTYDVWVRDAGIDSNALQFQFK
jgi:hypothetical protein